MVHRSGLRKMTAADVPAVHAIEQAVASGPWGEQLFHDCLKVGYECWVLVDDQAIMGYGILSYAANEAHILQFAIHPDHHRRGLGQKLLQHLLSAAKIHGADEMFLEVRQSNIPAINLYKKYSFVEIGLRKGYYPAEIEGQPKEDAITMALPLW
jgi:ribosomal-protein-alanine N-acetyltransferase